MGNSNSLKHNETQFVNHVECLGTSIEKQWGIFEKNKLRYIK